MTDSLSADDWVGDITAQNFETDVVQRSLTTPVVIDFWAEWCGPCKALGPMLERLVAEAAGGVYLAKIDVDSNPELAQTFQVQSIPMVLALKDGKLVDGFTGAKPEPELRAFLEGVIGGPLGSTGAASPGSSALAAAQGFEEAGDLAGAAGALAAHLSTTPDDAAAATSLARILLDLERVEEATAAFAIVTGEALETPEAAAVARRLELLSGGSDVAELEAKVAASPDDLAARIELGQLLAAKGRAADGLEHLIDAVERDREFDGQAARKAMIAIFDELGGESEVTGEYRRRLQMLLF